MTITITGISGEGKNCVANIIREAMESYGLDISMGNCPVFDGETAGDVMEFSKVEIRIVETI